MRIVTMPRIVAMRIVAMEKEPAAAACAHAVRGAGGALAIGVGDATFILQYSTYSVISPEGCASILWKSASKAEEAAQALGLTAERLLEHKLVDKIIPEPLGGAHRNPAAMAETLKAAIWDELQHLESLSLETLLDRRYQRLRAYGAYDVA